MPCCKPQSTASAVCVLRGISRATPVLRFGAMVRLFHPFQINVIRLRSECHMRIALIRCRVPEHSSCFTPGIPTPVIISIRQSEAGRCRVLRRLDKRYLFHSGEGLEKVINQAKHFR